MGEHFSTMEWFLAKESLWLIDRLGLASLYNILFSSKSKCIYDKVLHMLSL
jgi:hypothetical protein